MDNGNFALSNFTEENYGKKIEEVYESVLYTSYNKAYSVNAQQ